MIIILTIYTIIIYSCNFDNNINNCCSSNRNKQNKENKLIKEEKELTIKRSHESIKDDKKSYKPGICESIFNWIIIKFELDKPTELSWNEDLIPKDIKQLPRLIIGRSQEMIYNKNYIKLKIDDYHILYSKKDKTIGFKNRGPMPENDFEYFSSKGFVFRQIARIQPYLEKEGCITLKKNDITLDLEGAPHIKANAYKFETINEIKDKLADEKKESVKAIVFERAGNFPFNIKHIKLLNKNTDRFYNLNPYKKDKKLEKLNYYGMSGNRANLKVLYAQNKKFYPKVLRVEDSPEYLFNPMRDPIKFADLTFASKVYESNILKSYFNLLAPGGVFIYMSSSYHFNRHGGLVFKDENDNLFSPFENLDDERMKSFFKNILEEIGFINISFEKDPWFEEDVLFIKAFKPKKVNLIIGSGGRN
ncbi:MAG: hypothetical protein GY830_08265 [Bacteroidetes bacterium]|nr:hypothetical protein [Bacteroidota bacterium]